MKNETKTAAYLGYGDVAEFRRFKLCPVVLAWYIQFHENCQGLVVRGALQLIRDIENPDVAFPREKEKWDTMYPISEDPSRETRKRNNDNRIYRYAIILFRLCQDLERKDLYEDLDDSILQVFEKKLGVKLPDLSPNIVWPILGLLDKEESLERYSRVNGILKSLQTTLAPTKWKDTYGGENLHLRRH